MSTPIKVSTTQQSKDIQPFADSPSRFLGRDFESFFDNLDRIGWPVGAFGTLTRRAMPAVDVVETEKAFEVTAEAPGMTEKDITVELVNGDLRIRGEHKEEKEEKHKDYYLSERRHGSFERRFRVPEGVDAEKIEAEFKNGLLSITLPKTTESQKPAKKIPVKNA